MNWQEPVVIAIVGLCIVIVAYRFFSFFRKPKKEDDYCVNCPCGCGSKRRRKKS
ncbi:hypothetical protein EZS27_012566 [termite gut metagenome]|uniref:FeoB-associated Cys-rich membrane protein n=1 Tax=termite gut metagenome TaxID=433724 RepID=A0A5J4S0A0_9ZZZZ